ncbi:MAG TPA: PDZ domain-containing protein [Steroidobacteraceae bacterium]|nr:PDZ domain-containing protein [Steroidobacteraceae bacterium]
MQTRGAPRHALLAVLALAVLPGLAVAAEGSSAAGQDAERERTGRAQEDLVRRLEEARRRLADSSREVAELSRDLGRNTRLFTSVSSAPPRALLGIEVRNGAEGKGALVARVSPGGAAAEAGIQAGDIITSLHGQDLTGESDPGNALVKKMNQIEPDMRIRVDVLRDGRKLAFDVVPRLGAGPEPIAPAARAEAAQEQLELLRQRYTDNHPQVRALIEGIGLVGTPFTGTATGTPFGGMEFATLSEGLGKYFGVSKGVLVVRAGANSPYELQDGDVILSIDGRAPTNAQHAARILRSYQAGENVKLRVQRDRKAIDLNTSAPGGRGN